MRARTLYGILQHDMETRSMRVPGWITALCPVLVLTLFWPSRSHACSCAVGYVSSQPAAGAEGVFLNQAFELRGDLFDPDTLTIENARGEAHAFSLRSYRHMGPCPGGVSVELIPQRPFEANTHYEIRAAPRVVTAKPIAIGFSTGSELLPDPELEAPHARALLLGPPNYDSSCGPFTAIGCVSVDDFTDVEVTLRDGDTIIMRFPLSQTSQELVLWNTPTCIDLARRAATGRRSPVVSFCGEALRMRSASDADLCTDSAFSPSIHGNMAPVSPPMAAAPDAQHVSYGCAATPNRADGGFALVSLTMLGLWSAHRRRRSRDSGRSRAAASQ